MSVQFRRNDWDNTIDHLANILTGENHLCLVIGDHCLLCLMIKNQLIRVVTFLEFLDFAYLLVCLFSGSYEDV